jgi:hypothetical protein
VALSDEDTRWLAVAPHLVADGPAPQYRDDMMAVYAARFRS